VYSRIITVIIIEYSGCTGRPGIPLIHPKRFLLLAVNNFYRSYPYTVFKLESLSLRL